MISLSHLNKLIKFSIFFLLITINSALSTTAVDIWKKNENQNEQNNNEQNNEKDIIIKSPILSDDINKIVNNTRLSTHFSVTTFVTCS